MAGLHYPCIVFGGLRSAPLMAVRLLALAFRGARLQMDSRGSFGGGGPHSPAALHPRGCTRALHGEVSHEACLLKWPGCIAGGTCRHHLLLPALRVHCAWVRKPSRSKYVNALSA